MKEQVIVFGILGYGLIFFCCVALILNPLIFDLSILNLLDISIGITILLSNFTRKTKGLLNDVAILQVYEAGIA
ncbi:MAG: hypothetical protein Kow0080_17680 [Candidatus Promineifilaceae bacterium]